MVHVVSVQFVQIPVGVRVERKVGFTKWQIVNTKAVTKMTSISSFLANKINDMSIN